MTEPRTISLFRNGRNQAIRIPVDMELPGTEALIRRDGDRLIIEPKRQKKTILDVLREFGPLDEPFPDVDDSDLPPARDIDLA